MFDNFLFITAACMTIICSLLVVVTKDIMHACIYLLGSLLGVAGLYVTLGADFVAATQMVVYVGGVVILMVFAVMLTGGASGQKENKYGIEKTPLMGSKKTYIWGIFSAIVLGCSAFKIIKNVFTSYQAKDPVPYEATTSRIGELLLTDHVLAFELSSVLLLGALVGAALIARPNRKAEESL